MSKYVMVIHSPYNFFDILAEYGSEMPFLTVSIGDSFNPKSFDLEEYPELKLKIFRVIDVQHSLADNDELGSVEHRIDVFTESVETVIAQKITRETAGKTDDEMKAELAKLLGISVNELPD